MRRRALSDRRKKKLWFQAVKRTLVRVKEKALKYSLGAICQIFGYQRQTYYKRSGHSQQLDLWDQMILNEVKTIRTRQPKVGTRKLHKMVNERLKEDNIQIGRDRLFALLRANDLLIRQRRNYKQTTYSYHHFRKYGNLIQDLNLTRPNEVYVADITYIETLEGYCYLALITDAYSRKIVGYDLSRSLCIEGSLRALQMAIEQLKGPIKLIHHSDRGIQYCSHAYVDLLNKHGIQISMTEENHVYENALAERVNGILKNEFMIGETLLSYANNKELVKESIHIYNTERLHLSLDYMTPEAKHAA